MYFSLKELRGQSKEIIEEFERLLSQPAFSSHKNAKQWKFFRHCLNVVMGKARCEYRCGKQAAIQYKFEIMDRCRRYYAGAGNSVRYIFSLVPVKEVRRYGLVSPRYPDCNGYCLLISSNDLEPDIENTRGLLERVVAEAMDAEWAVFCALPEVNLDVLKSGFASDGPAYRRIKSNAEDHARRGWTICNEDNPSSRRLMDVKVVKMKKQSAEVRTTEYWYLRYWSARSKEYEYIYNETNHQRYILEKRKGKWLVVENIYPPPHNSAPRRWYGRKKVSGQ